MQFVVMSAMANIIAAVLTAWVGNTGYEAFKKLAIAIKLIPDRTEETYGKRIGDLTASLSAASADVDRVLEEMAAVALERQGGIEQLEEKLKQLASRENELKAQVETLAKLPLPVADYFAKLVNEGSRQGEKRSARRDYMLFFAGVVVSALIPVFITAFNLIWRSIHLR